MSPRYAPRYGPVTPQRNGRNGPFRRALACARIVYITYNYYTAVSSWKSLKGFSNYGNIEFVIPREVFS